MEKSSRGGGRGAECTANVFFRGKEGGSEPAPEIVGGGASREKVVTITGDGLWPWTHTS